MHYAMGIVFDMHFNTKAEQALLAFDFETGS
jgi:hypothetical protein